MNDKEKVCHDQIIIYLVNIKKRRQTLRKITYVRTLVCLDQNLLRLKIDDGKYFSIRNLIFKEDKLLRKFKTRLLRMPCACHELVLVSHVIFILFCSMACSRLALVEWTRSKKPAREAKKSWREAELRPRSLSTCFFDRPHSPRTWNRMLEYKC